MEKKKQELKEMTEEKYVEVLRLTAENAELNRLLDEAKTELNFKTEEAGALQRCKTEIMKLTTHVDQLVKSLTDSEKLIAEKALEFMDLKVSKERLSVALEAASAEMQSLAQLSGELELRIQQLSSSLELKGLEGGASGEEVQVLQDQVACLRGREEELIKENSRLKETQDSLEVQIATLNSQETALREEIGIHRQKP